MKNKKGVFGLVLVVLILFIIIIKVSTVIVNPELKVRGVEGTEDIVMTIDSKSSFVKCSTDIELKDLKNNEDIKLTCRNTLFPLIKSDVTVKVSGLLVNNLDNLDKQALFDQLSNDFGTTIVYDQFTKILISPNQEEGYTEANPNSWTNN